jgi:hypothetical protein
MIHYCALVYISVLHELAYILCGRTRFLLSVICIGKCIIVTYFMLLTVLYPPVFRPCDDPQNLFTSSFIIDCFNCKYRLYYSVLMVKFMHMFIFVNLLPLVELHSVVLLCWHCSHGTICTLYCFYLFVCVYYVSLLYSCLY